MPLAKNQLEQLQKINDGQNRWGGHAAPKAELLQRCGCSLSTLKKDLRLKQKENGAKISFNRRLAGYEYTEPFDLSATITLTDRDLIALETTVSTLSQYSHLDTFRDWRGMFNKLERAVQFRFFKPADERQFLKLESVLFFRGEKLIASFRRAVRNQQRVHFQHHRFDKDTVHSHRLIPYLIKELRNRWNVVGWQHENAEIRLFRRDCFVSDSIQPVADNADAPDFGAQADFQNSLDVAVYVDKQPEEIILSFTPKQGRYFRTLPYFSYGPDDVLIDFETKFRVRINLIINDELGNELARLGPGVKVLRPNTFVNKLHHYLLTASQQYQLPVIHNH